MKDVISRHLPKCKHLVMIFIYKLYKSIGIKHLKNAYFPKKRMFAICKQKSNQNPSNKNS